MRHATPRAPKDTALDSSGIDALNEHVHARLQALSDPITKHSASQHAINQLLIATLHAFTTFVDNRFSRVGDGEFSSADLRKWKDMMMAEFSKLERGQETVLPDSLQTAYQSFATALEAIDPASSKSKPNLFRQQLQVELNTAISRAHLEGLSQDPGSFLA